MRSSLLPDSLPLSWAARTFRKFILVLRQCLLCSRPVAPVLPSGTLGDGSRGCCGGRPLRAASGCCLPRRLRLPSLLCALFRDISCPQLSLSVRKCARPPVESGAGTGRACHGPHQSRPGKRPLPPLSLALCRCPACHFWSAPCVRARSAVSWNARIHYFSTWLTPAPPLRLSGTPPPPGSLP